MLLEAGASTMQTGTTLAPPELASTDGKPPRPAMKPDDRPIVSFDGRWRPPPGAPPLVGGYPLEGLTASPTESGSVRPQRSVAPLLFGGVALGALGIAALRRSSS